MPDNKSKTGAPDTERINIEQDYERREWSRRLGVSEDELRRVVQQHGTSVKAIKEALGK
jgi:hypothetical protein